MKKLLDELNNTYIQEKLLNAQFDFSWFLSYYEDYKKKMNDKTNLTEKEKKSLEAWWEDLLKKMRIEVWKLYNPSYKDLLSEKVLDILLKTQMIL